MLSGIKTPAEVLDYTLDWADWLADGADTISTSAWTLPAGVVEDASSNTTTTTTIFVSSGTVGQTYTLTNQITTANGRTAERSMKISVVERKWE